MQATVTRINDGHVFAVVRRGYREESVEARREELDNLKRGDKINVKRETNNPYLVYQGRVE